LNVIVFGAVSTRFSVITMISRLLLIFIICALNATADTLLPSPVALTPPSPKTPQIHGPKVFGVRPGSPFLYTIPATGDRPMTFSADGLPDGLKLDETNGQITGSLSQPGTIQVTFHARNSLGQTDRPFKIVVGDDIALTPPMGWNSWNCWGTGISQEKVLKSARAMIKAGLDQHGWTYVNIDDAWQGARGGDLNAIQPDPKTFPDIKSMADEIHGMGLKLGIYSTPWVTSYGGHVGGSSENSEGTWDKATMTKGPKNRKQLPFAIGQYHFFTNDAKQWAAWGVDYLKFDWAPNELPETMEMEGALRASGRDIVLSLSNNTTNSLFNIIGDMSKVANCWRIGGDINDSWGSIVGHGFHQDKWATFARPGHWNDPDMFEIGANGGGSPKRLTPDEQYTHVSLWCLVSAPLLLGCDLDHLDDFTLGLLTNDEVIDVDQDESGKEATHVSGQGDIEVYAKPLADGSWAAGLFNLGKTEAPVTVKWSDLGLSGKQKVRDLWRQQDAGSFDDGYTVPVASHGVVLIRVSP
jgi:alpha-galactosidase